MKKFLLLVLATACIYGAAIAQGRFMIGAGINYISNQYDQAHLYDYFAPSLHVGYALAGNRKLELVAESASSLRLSGNETTDVRKTGFTTAAPLLVNLKLRKLNLFAGSGPAYISQASRGSEYSEKASGFYLNTLAGIGFGGGSVLANSFYSKCQVRIGYLSALSPGRPAGGIISFVAMFRKK